MEETKLLLEIESYIEKGLDNKNFFRKYNYSDLVLSRTNKKGIRRNTYDVINKVELRAFKAIFRNIFDDFKELPSSNFIWDTIYAFPELNCKQEKICDDILEYDFEYPVPVNSTKQCAKNFLLSILNKANDVFESSDLLSKALIREARIFLIGDIGIGKTTFFKYLNSSYREIIRTKYNCFWLHIDFTKDYLNTLSIPEAIKFHAAKVFRRDYLDYLEEDELKSFEDSLRPYFTDYNQNREMNELQFQTAYREYISKYEQERTKPYFSRLQDGIINFLEKNYPVIYILDGLDNINSDINFVNKVSDVHNIISDENRKGFFIFIMRNESHKLFLNEHSDTQNKSDIAKLLSKYKTFRIEPAKLNELILKRFTLLLKRWEIIVDKNKSSILTRKPNDSLGLINNRYDTLINKIKEFIKKDELESYFNVFLIYMHTGIKFETELNLNNWKRIGSISELKNFIGNNYRKLMDAINFIHDSFLESIQPSNDPISNTIAVGFAISKEKNNFLKRNDYLSSFFNKLLSKDYKVIPRLLLGLSNYQHPYTYIFNSIENKMVRVENTPLARFLYNVFYSINIVGKAHEQYTLLLKIRILQMLFNYGKSDSIKIVNEYYIIKYFSMYFPYNIERIKFAILELKEMHLIKQELSSNGYHFMITRVGENHVNNLIYNFGYIRIILDDILVPNNTEDKFIDPVPDQPYKHIWIINQIPRITLFLLLVKEAEKHEESFSGFSQNPDNIDWSILNKMRISIKESILRISLAHDKDLNKLKAAYVNHYSQ